MHATTARPWQTIDCSDLPVRAINRAIRSAIAEGMTNIRLLSPTARHNLGVGLPQQVHLVIEGSVGYYVAGLNDGATLEVRGSAGWGAAESMRTGTVVIDGDAANAVAASIREGTVVVKGNASTRAGIAMKGGTLIIAGSAGPMAGFMMQKGTIIICADAADGVADSMYAGTIFVGGRTGELGADSVLTEASPEEHALLRAELDRWQIPAPVAFRKLVSGRRLWNFQKADIHLWKSAL
ncbi:MAG TPA: glutamate synthase [Isosphaeraceae bacterium]|nr:glutamate synthase [Isosphaeraceae bacterium]